MTAEELIKELMKYPKDTEVYKFNKSYDYYTSDTIDWIASIELDAEGNLLIK